jgi:hypothetical protein
LWLAHFMTWWTVLLEGAVAVAFLWPLERGVSRGAMRYCYCSVRRPMPSLR